MIKHVKTFFANWVAKVLLLVVGLVLVALCGVLWLYSGKTTQAKWAVLSRLHLPAGKVGSAYIGANVAYNYQLVTGLGSNNIPPLSSLLALEAVASDRVMLGASELEAMAAELESNELYRQAVKTYGKDLAKDTLARQAMLDVALRVWYDKESGVEPELQARLQKAKQALGSGVPFAKVAVDASDDTATKWFSGDAGFVDLSLAVGEYARVVEELPLNTLSTVYSRHGVHLVEVLERTTQDGREFTRLREIVLRPKNYETWLAGEIKKQVFSWYLQ